MHRHRLPQLAASALCLAQWSRPAWALAKGGTPRALAWPVASLALLVLAALAMGWARARGTAARTRSGELERRLSVAEAERDRLRMLIEASPDGLWMKDLEGVYLECNERALHIVGRTREQVIGKTARDVFPAGRAPRIEAGDAEALSTGRRVRSEEGFVDADDQVRELEVLRLPVPAPGGGYAGVLGVVHDLTEQRRMERDIRLWAEAFHAAGFGLSISDARSNRFIDVNPAFAAQRGYDREELLGQPTSSVIPEANLERYLRNREHSDRVLHSVYESDALRKDGQLFPVLLDVTVLLGADGMPERRIVYSLDITERRRIEEERRLWAHTFEHAGFGVAVSDVDSNRIVAANRAYARQRGYTPEEIVGRPVSSLYPPERLEQARQMLAKASHDGQWVFESEHVKRSGERFPVSLDVTLVHDDRGRVRYRVVYSQDITARREAERELRIAAAAFESQEGILVTDARGTIQRVNSAFTRITGFEAAYAIGKHPAMLRAKGQGSDPFAPLLRSLARLGYWSGEMWSRRRSGELFLAHVAVSAVRDDAGTVLHYVGTMTDITGAREAERRAERLVRYDALTDLPNRQYLREIVNDSIALAGKSGELGALMVIDIDHFAGINAAHGQHRADLLLVMLAKRLRLAMRHDDALGRGGGDMFVVLMEGLGGDWMHAARRANQAAAQVRDAVAEPFDLPDKRIAGVSVSIGLTLFGRGAAFAPDCDMLVAQAETAMYRAKQAGRNAVRMFEPEMQAELEARNRLVEELRAGIAQQQLRLHFQAQVADDGATVAAEVLVRWQHPARGLLHPDSFIGIAEETGLIDLLGHQVLRMACAQIAAWSHDSRHRALSLSVNVSPLQFQRDDFVAEVLATVADSGIDPGLLKLELTESMIMEDLDDAVAKLGLLRERGIRISLDDFGTGSSSLSYLTRLPLDQIKIDKAFVRNLPGSRSDALVAQTIIAMAKGLGLEVVAEGVETPAQLQFLRGQACDLYQGYLLGRPVPLEDFVRLPTVHA